LGKNIFADWQKLVERERKSGRKNLPAMRRTAATQIASIHPLEARSEGGPKSDWLQPHRNYCCSITFRPVIAECYSSGGSE
jgi:hypothetical protein